MSNIEKVESHHDYPYVFAWNKMFGSFPYYIRTELEKARADHAPYRAIHKRKNGEWATIDDIKSMPTVLALNNTIRSFHINCEEIEL